MKAMILAAGRGERMRPLTDSMPKPLLSVGGKPLIVYHLEKLSALGVTQVIINIAYLGDKIRQTLGDGKQWGLTIHYSEESYPLETGGALNQALNLLGDEPFLLINGDVWCDIDFNQIVKCDVNYSVGHLFFVDNPQHNPLGDFCLDELRVITKQEGDPAYTFAGIALIDPKMIREYPRCREVFALKEVFVYYIEQQLLAGSLYDGFWCDVGTPERLNQLDDYLSLTNKV
jgi:MurNAc alpha-1-phosphate uridylyltransferase